MKAAARGLLYAICMRLAVIECWMRSKVLPPLGMWLFYNSFAVASVLTVLAILGVIGVVWVMTG